MKTSLLILLLLCGAMSTRSQSSYSVSIAGYQENYKKELASIIKNDTAFVAFFDVDPALRIETVYTPLRDQPVFNMGTSSGTTKQAQKIGKVKFVIDKKSYELSAYQLLALRTNPAQQDLFFIPFTDGTSGVETYSSGRYLDFKLGDIKNAKSLVVDFNKAYNPYCAFVDGYNCPIPPPENQLPVAIKAGEKSYGKKWK
jgi:uncharacterized protein